eukprot:10069345-Ditylum_brightwellii.AAC.1
MHVMNGTAYHQQEEYMPINAITSLEHITNYSNYKLQQEMLDISPKWQKKEILQNSITALLIP